MKKHICFLLAAAMTVCLFGCVKSGSETISEPETQATAAMQTPETEPRISMESPETAPVTEIPTEAPIQPPTEVPTEAPTEAPTEPVPAPELSVTELTLTKKGEQAEIYCGEVPVEQISWLSEDESVAVFSRGVVIAINPGTTMVYATYRDQTVSCLVTCDVAPDDPAARIPAKLRNAPRMAPPYVADMADTSFFDDAAFIGDSVSHVLQQWHIRSGAFGKATFLVRNALGLQNTIDGRMKINYQGKSLSPEDAVAKAGVKKLFVMLGFNDVGLFGIDGTLERWDIFLGRILEKSPELEIYIQSCTAIHEEGEMKSYSNELFDEYNAALEEYCAENGYHFVNIAPYFKDYTNGMPTVYSSDKFVHMSFEGTAVWEQVLKAYAAEQKGDLQ